MNDSREHEGWLDATVAERLLSGEDIAEADSRVAGLARLLAMAAEPLPADREREHAALAAFRQARDDGHLSRGLRQRTVGSLTSLGSLRSRSTKALMGGMAAVFVLGGVAIAAQTGNLPFHSGGATAGPVPSTTTATASSGPGAVTRHPSGTLGPAQATGSAHPTRPASQPSSQPATTSATNADPAAKEVKGLCAKYVDAADHGQSLDSHSQARLEQVAGGKSEVDAYCARLLGTPAGHGKSPDPPAPQASRTTGPPANPRK